MRHLLPIAALLAAAAAAPAGAQTLLIGNKGEDSVSIVDLPGGREQAKVPTGPKPHEIAVSPDRRVAAVVAYGGHTIDLIDVPGRRRLRSIDLSRDAAAHGLVWLADGRLIAASEKPGALLVIAPADGVVKRIPTGAERSHMVAVTPDARRAFVANIGSGSVGVFDLSTMTKLRDLAVGGEPEGIAVALDGRQLWVGDNGSGRLRVYDTATLEPLGEVAVPPHAIRVVASPDGRTVATSSFAQGSVTLVDAATRRVIRTIPVSGSKDAQQVTILFSPDGRMLYVAETGPDTIAEIDLASGQIRRRIRAGADGDGLAIVTSRRGSPPAR